MGAAPVLERGKSLAWLGEQFVARQGLDQQAGATRCFARAAGTPRRRSPRGQLLSRWSSLGVVESARVTGWCSGAGWRSWEATWRGDRRAKRCPRRKDSSRGFSSWAGGRAASLEYEEEAYVEFKAVEEQQQALLSGELFEMEAERAGRAALPSVGCQGIGQEELFVGRRRSPRAAVSFVRRPGLLTAPSHAWSAR